MIDVLQSEILKILKVHPGGVSEFDLLQELSDPVADFIGDVDGNIGLFRQHFVLMHCLYRLQQTLWNANNEVLHISPLKINVEVCEGKGKGKGKGKDSLMAEAIDPSLRDYYLDWNHYANISEEEVDGLLENFWQQYVRFVQQDEAWGILNLPADSPWKVIAARYRELAAEHHPDKGGSSETFIKIRGAYESLRTTIK